MINDKIDVLDHGYIRLIDHMGGDLSIVRSARVSYDAEWRPNSGAGDKVQGDEKLIRYLMRNRHTTPFEAVQLSFEIVAPIFVVRQWHRHRTWSYNEVSARYTPLPEKFYVPKSHLIGKQNADNKQMRDPMTPEEFADLPYAEQYSILHMRLAIQNQNGAAFETYTKLLEMGMPRELARSVLPVGTYTHFFAQVNLHNLFHFLRLRLHTHAQYEIRVYAEAILELITPVAPVAVQAFKDSLAGTL